MFLCEEIEGTQWTVAHDTDTRRIVVTPTPPDWVSPEYAAAWEAGLRATAAGRCPECGAVSPEPEDAQPMTAGRPPHDPACPLSEESLSRMTGNVVAIAKVSDEAADAIRAYCRDLTDSMLWAGTEER